MEHLAKQKFELQKRLNSLKRPTDQSIPLSDKGNVEPQNTRRLTGRAMGEGVGGVRVCTAGYLGNHENECNQKHLRLATICRHLHLRSQRKQQKVAQVLHII